MRPLKRLLERTPLRRWLWPAWVDEARRLSQEPAFRRVLAGHTLAGACLNAGCGDGLYAPFLESFPGLTRVVNVDLATPAIAARRKDPRHEDLAASVTELPFSDASFDCCLCSEVLEHVEDDRRAVAELARVLRPGGLLLVSVPTPPAPEDPAHVREGYAREELESLLRAHGLAPLAHTTCFHVLMRTLYVTWHWQERAAGRNLFPRALLRALGHADRYLRVGPPWDLVVLARKAG